MQAEVVTTVLLLVETECSLGRLKRRAPESSPQAEEKPNNEETDPQCLLAQPLEGWLSGACLHGPGISVCCHVQEGT